MKGDTSMFWSPHMYYSWGHSNFWGFPSLLSILFWVGIILLFFSLFNRSSNTTEQEEESDGITALDILKKRYAKGEITKREFENMKKDVR